MHRQSFPSNFNRVSRTATTKKDDKKGLCTINKVVDWENPIIILKHICGWTSESMPAEFSKKYTNTPWRLELQMSPLVSCPLKLYWLEEEGMFWITSVCFFREHYGEQDLANKPWTLVTHVAVTLFRNQHIQCGWELMLSVRKSQSQKIKTEKHVQNRK